MKRESNLIGIYSCSIDNFLDASEMGFFRVKKFTNHLCDPFIGVGVSDVSFCERELNVEEKSQERLHETYFFICQATSNANDVPFDVSMWKREIANHEML